VMTSSIVSTARAASLRLSPDRSATWPMSSCLFIAPTLPSAGETRSHRASSL